jgi:hypothetical protein
VPTYNPAKDTFYILFIMHLNSNKFARKIKSGTNILRVKAFNGRYGGAFVASEMAGDLKDP